MIEHFSSPSPSPSPSSSLSSSSFLFPLHGNAAAPQTEFTCSSFVTDTQLGTPSVTAKKTIKKQHKPNLTFASSFLFSLLRHAPRLLPALLPCNILHAPACDAALFPVAVAVAMGEKRKKAHFSQPNGLLDEGFTLPEKYSFGEEGVVRRGKPGSLFLCICPNLLRSQTEHELRTAYVVTPPTSP